MPAEPPDTTQVLLDAWSALVNELGWTADAATAVRDELLAAWAEPHRHYHDRAHLAAVLRTLAELVAPGSPGTGARLAAWFHDAVYDATRADNEQRSAHMAAARLGALGTSPKIVEDVVKMVAATAAHAGGSSLPADGSAFLDADLAILGSEPDDYARYATGIRAEYLHIPEGVYRPGRAAVLRSFLSRPALFATEAGRQRFEAAARRNLAGEIESLGAGPTPVGEESDHRHH